MTFISLGSYNLWAQEKGIQLTTVKTTTSDPKENVVPTIPVYVDIKNTVLGIHFEKVKQVFVSVVGPDGVVYQREVTTETAKSLYVDLAQYREGEYTIYFTDAKGNQISGDFLNEKESDYK